MTETKKPVQAPEPDAALPVSRDAILAQFAQYLAAVPDAEMDDGSGIVAEIMQATSWEDVNVAGGLPNIEKLLGRRIKITGFGKVPSDLPDGLPYYLLGTAVDPETGEVFKFQTSSVTTVAQLVKLRMLGKHTVMADVTSDKTRKGFDAYSLKIIAAS